MLFYKMNGLGNDYIFIDAEKANKNDLRFFYNNLKDVVINLSNRNFGIGGDGVVIVDNSIVADAKMRIFNADGTEGNTCGNALRCIGKILFDKNVGRRKDFTVETLCGIKQVFVQSAVDNSAILTINMGKAKIVHSNDDIDFIDVGNPHAVVYVPTLDNKAILKAKRISNKYDVNAEVVNVLNDNQIQMRVWERGSNETMACGSGACAVAYSANKRGRVKDEVEVLLKGGKLLIKLTNDELYMTGEVQLNYIGEVNIYNYG
ncbi:MAG: diaminopimelate epimerase [Clostridia bacterium]|nr:diaminopimelate epimerase [Clostridia bacterium]